MTLEERITAFSALGDKIRAATDSILENHFQIARNENSWFTSDNVKRALDGIAFMLSKDKLDHWVTPYSLNAEVPRIVGIVMAGNIPLVGFHDLLAVLLSGHFAAIKTSKQDHHLPTTITDWLIDIEPRFKKNLAFRDRLNNVDAVIATGSDNTSRYFEYYFRKIPNVIRKNRSSLAIIDGSESDAELKELGKDLFWYYGLGCRNVSKLLVPSDYDPKQFFEAIEEYNYVGDHHKYRNNYDYHKSILLVNGVKHLDNGFLLWVPSEELVSALSVLHFQEYSDPQETQNYINLNREKIQCIISRKHIPFGHAQNPEPWDYADNVDTLAFLADL